jgi:hypothetical protein
LIPLVQASGIQVDTYILAPGKCNLSMRALPVNPIPHIQVMIDIDTVAEREG